MKIYEVTEAVKPVNDTDHAIERVKVAAKLCENIGNTPIMYRMFSDNKRKGIYNLMIKVNNEGGERKGVKGNHNPFQQQIFTGLKLKNPTQVLTTTPNKVRGFHGTNYIMIPSSDFKAVWNPDIPDLGGFEGYNDKYKAQDPGGGLRRTTMRPDDYDYSEEVNRALAGYKEGVPSQSEWNGEIIVDTPFYYMLNLQDFLQKYAGKKSRELVNASQKRWPDYGTIKKELLQAKFKTYRDVAWYLKNPTMNFLNWWKEKEQQK